MRPNKILLPTLLAHSRVLERRSKRGLVDSCGADPGLAELHSREGGFTLPNSLELGPRAVLIRLAKPEVGK
jgi:hypothetical protein